MVLTKLPWSRLTSASETAEIVKVLQSMSSIKNVMPAKIGPVLTLGIKGLGSGFAPLWDAICRVFGCRAVVSSKAGHKSVVFVGTSENITLAALACRKIGKSIDADGAPHLGSAESLHMHIRKTFADMPGYLFTNEAVRCRIKAMGKVTAFVKPVWA